VSNLPDANALAAYRRGLARAGQSVVVQRWTGQAPNRTVTAATVSAFVRYYAPDDASVARTGFGEGKPGAITQTERHVIVLACDLQDQLFPLPVKKNDKIVVQGETLNVTDVDPNTRYFAGAIDLTVSGV
jgi:hypothetical protein